MRVRLIYPSGTKANITCDDARVADNEDGTKTVTIINGGKDSVLPRMKSMEVISNG